MQLAKPATSKTRAKTGRYLGGSDANALPGPLRTFFPLALAAVFINCGGGSPALAPAPAPQTSGTPTIIFSASTNAITAGQVVALTWQATNATSVTITAFTGSTSGTGTRTSQASGKLNDSPTQTTTYSAVATGSGGSSQPMHAYDATSVSTELWNSEMNATRDALGEGIGFSTPVVVNGRVITT
jgi:hypothetical protein